MKILVMSDSHGASFFIDDILTKYTADYYIHLGDGKSDINKIASKYPDVNITHIKGNCDYDCSSNLEEFMVLADNCRILAVHGHEHKVKYSLEPLKEKAKTLGANIILYGHTHERYCSYEDGLYIMNPGSVACPRDGNKRSVGMIDVSPAGIMTNIIDLS